MKDIDKLYEKAKEKGKINKSGAINISLQQFAEIMGEIENEKNNNS